MAAPVLGAPSSTVVTRFAPSPTGYLHMGHAFSAFLAANVAKRMGGRFLLRIEDIDHTRCTKALTDSTFEDLAWLGLRWEEPVRRQSEHRLDYLSALTDLQSRGLVYPCFCTRSEIKAAALARLHTAPKHAGQPQQSPDGGPIYPGTCRALSEDERANLIKRGTAHAWRLDTDRALAWLQTHRPGTQLSWREISAGSNGIDWQLAAHSLEAANTPTQLSYTLVTPDEEADGLTGGNSSAYIGEKAEHRPQTHTRVPSVRSFGDIVLARKDIGTSYHLSVVVDDGLQGITHIIRGYDLYAATPLHRLLQALLDLPQPDYHHHGLIPDLDGLKLAKSKGSKSLRDLRAEGLSPSDIFGAVARAEKIKHIAF